MLVGSSDWLEGYLPGFDRVKLSLKDWIHSLGVFLDPAPSMEVQYLLQPRVPFMNFG